MMGTKLHGKTVEVYLVVILIAVVAQGQECNKCYFFSQMSGDWKLIQTSNAKIEYELTFDREQSNENSITFDPEIFFEAANEAGVKYQAKMFFPQIASKSTYFTREGQSLKVSFENPEGIPMDLYQWQISGVDSENQSLLFKSQGSYFTPKGMIPKCPLELCQDKYCQKCSPSEQKQQEMQKLCHNYSNYLSSLTSQLPISNFISNTTECSGQCIQANSCVDCGKCKSDAFYQLKFDFRSNRDETYFHLNRECDNQLGYESLNYFYTCCNSYPIGQCTSFAKRLLIQSIMTIMLLVL